MQENAGRPTYHTTIREMPPTERPRERLAQYGERSLSTAELLARRWRWCRGVRREGLPARSSATPP